MKFAMLHDAIIADDLAAVREMLKSGADPNARNRRSFSALHEAVMYRRTLLIPLLLQHGGDPNLKAPDHGDCLEMSARRDDIEILRLLCPDKHEPNIA